MTQDQKIRIEEIVEQIEAKRREYSLQKQAEIEKLIDQMKKDLNNDQQKKLDALRENFKKRQKARGERQFSR